MSESKTWKPVVRALGVLAVTLLVIAVPGRVVATHGTSTTVDAIDGSGPAVFAGTLDNTTGDSADWYTFYGVAGSSVTIGLSSAAFDPFLNLYMTPAPAAAGDARAAFVLVASDDDSGPGFNSLVVLDLPATGYYVVAAESFSSEGELLGSYEITIAGDVTAVASTVRLDVRPGSDVNPINLGSRGLIPVAILGSETVDVISIDLATLRFGPNGAPPAHDLSHLPVEGGHLEDVNDDGYPDLVAHFRTAAVGLEDDALEACLWGAFLDGSAFTGCDAVWVLR